MHRQGQYPSIGLLLLLPLLLLVGHPFNIGNVGLAYEAQGANQLALSEEPLLRELLSSELSRLENMTSCLDSVFKLKRAFEVIYSLKSVYNDFLSNRTDKLTEFEEKLLLFCRDPLPTGTDDTVNLYFEHPLNVHKFVIYIARSINPKFLELIKGHSGVRLMLRQLLSNADCWLNEASVSESMQGLLTIKQFYNISIGDFAGGNFSGHLSASGGLTTPELMEILLHLNRQFDPVQVAELAEFLRRERKNDMLGLGEQPVRSLYRILGKAYYQMKQFDSAVKVLREYKSVSASVFGATASKPNSRDRGVDTDLSYIDANRHGDPKDFEAEVARALTSLERDFGLQVDAKRSEREGFAGYLELCRGGSSSGPLAENASTDPLLICEFWRPYNGWYAVRKEMLSVHPLVVRFFDVFTPGDNSTGSLLHEAEKRIFEAPPEEFSKEAAHMKLTKVRVHSLSHYVPPFDSNATQSIIRRIEWLSGLDASLSFKSGQKYIEMVNFGHGIRNRPHEPPRLPHRFYDGMANAVFFPVDNVAGGEIIFPKKNLKIPIKKSDLYIWYSYMPMYTIDTNGTVASCPIVYGDKWTAQVTLGLTRCSLDQEVMLESLLPGKTLTRRRSVARSWKVLIQPKKPKASKLALNGTLNATTTTNETAAAANATGLNGTEELGFGTNEDASDAEQERTTKVELAGNTTTTESVDSASVPLDEEAKGSDSIDASDGDVIETVDGGDKETADEVNSDISA